MNSEENSGEIRSQVEAMLRALMTGHDVGGHGFDHFIAVANHAVAALKCETLSPRKKLEVELAALLHDVDDSKIFPDSMGYQNARAILEKIDVSDKDELIENAIEMIDLVSCSKNGDREPPEPYMAIPRDCDWLEAIGQIGIDRCRDFTIYKQAPFHVDSTPRAYTEEQVWMEATPERFTAYMNGAKSASMIDHYYDKLLHIGKPAHLRSQNPYILEEAARRNHIMVEFIINYWLTATKVERQMTCRIFGQFDFITNYEPKIRQYIAETFPNTFELLSRVTVTKLGTFGACERSSIAILLMREEETTRESQFDWFKRRTSQVINTTDEKVLIIVFSRLPMPRLLMRKEEYTHLYQTSTTSATQVHIHYSNLQNWLPDDLDELNDIFEEIQRFLTPNLLH
jgi:uncharacterized protein